MAAWARRRGGDLHYGARGRLADVVTDGQRLWTFHTDYTSNQVVLAAKEP